MFVVFEGIDGSGKTSVLNGVKQVLHSSDIPVFVNCETDNHFGKMAKYGIHEYPEFMELDGLSRNTMFLWWLARAVQQNRISNFNGIVLQDRYYDSTYIYQNLENTTAETFSYDPEFFITPDITFLFDVSPEVSLDRCKNNLPDVQETKVIENLEDRRRRYLELPKKHTWRKFEIINTDEVTIDYLIGKCSSILFREWGDL